MWGRGLKLLLPDQYVTRTLSPPMWGRGLKLISTKCYKLHQVAPHVGAWIETLKMQLQYQQQLYVAPHVGAWIETGHLRNSGNSL